MLLVVFLVQFLTILTTVQPYQLLTIYKIIIINPVAALVMFYEYQQLHYK